jgi:hypothetical protein
MLKKLRHVIVRLRRAGRQRGLGVTSVDAAVADTPRLLCLRRQSVRTLLAFWP